MIKKLILRLMYPHRYSSEAYIEYCKSGGATIGENLVLYNPRSIWIDDTSLGQIFIGDNVIIGAGSVVTGEVESNSVYAGNPARKIRTLEQHWENCKKNFEDSARCYIQRLKREEKTINDETMIIYQALYKDKNAMNSIVQKFDYRGIEKKKIKEFYPNYKKYNSLIEMLRKIGE